MKNSIKIILLIIVLLFAFVSCKNTESEQKENKQKNIMLQSLSVDELVGKENSYFIAHNYKTSYDIEEAVSIVYAAKKAAEAAPGVGQETDICIITQEGIINLLPEMIAELSKIYNEVRKAPVEEIKEKSKRLKDLLKKMEEKENVPSE